jgi:hypothetical protein
MNKKRNRRAAVSNLTGINSESVNSKSRSQRRQAFDNAKMATVRRFRVLALFLNIFRPHWAAWVFWPLLGLLWGAMHQTQHGGADLYAIGFIMGMGSALFFSLGERKFSVPLMAAFGMVAGYGFGLFIGKTDDALLFSFIGLGGGLSWRYLISVLGYF